MYDPAQQRPESQNFYLEAIPGSEKDHKLSPPRHHPVTDHPKEILNVPSIVDSTHLLLIIPLDKWQPITGPEP